MLLMIERQKQEQQIAPEEPVKENDVREADLRRLMYERIARGNALAEIEENARSLWHHK